MTENKIKILIIDDHTMFREGVKRVIEMIPTLKWLGKLATGKKDINWWKRFSLK